MNICIAVYGTFSDVFENGLTLSFKQLGLIVDVMYCSTLLFVFCDCSHKCTLEVAKGVQNTLLSLDMMSLDTQAKREVDLFIVAIEMNPAVVSLRGYLDVNRELLTSVCMNCVVLVIFQQPLLSVHRYDRHLFACFDPVQVFFGQIEEGGVIW